MNANGKKNRKESKYSNAACNSINDYNFYCIYSGKQNGLHWHKDEKRTWLIFEWDETIEYE